MTDYPDIVKKPMDLGTLKENLKNGKYLTIGDCLDDLQLIWSNCKLYNVQGSEIWKLANILEKNSNKFIEKTFKLTGKDAKKLLSSLSAQKDEESAPKDVNSEIKDEEESQNKQ